MSKAVVFVIVEAAIAAIATVFLAAAWTSAGSLSDHLGATGGILFCWLVVGGSAGAMIADVMR